ncbi:MAG: hypothetical protein DRH37_10335 [Deltaproteobacteria bacterium]|nr:MAG: hypothetical protein DRH37_10335 [Deltaproteobacteria bacterium]
MEIVSLQCKLKFPVENIFKPGSYPNSCPSINEIRGTGEFPIRKCEFSRKAKEIKGLCGGVHPVRCTRLRAGTHRQAPDPAD